MKTRFIIAGMGNRGLGCFPKGLLGWETKGHGRREERAGPNLAEAPLDP